MQGNPDPDPDRFPHGLTPVSQAVDAIGLRFLVWFEPERVMRGSWLEREHADWLLWPSDTPAALRYMEQDGFALLDLGNPDARAWAVESTSKYITDANISIYRLDCNLYPAYFWHTPEAADEVGLREIRYINGLYAFLDELASRHPQLIIDNCASGGRRLDFETLRRSVVLWRSDSTWGAPTFPRNVQAMTMGLSHWLPLHGLGSNATDEIALRSGMGACASFAIDFRNQDSVATLRRHLERYHTVRPLFAADFYPLTPWSDDPAAWLAFQFHDPQRGEGLVQAFRASTDEARPIKLRLRGLQPDQRFECFDWDQPGTVTIRSGAELITTGIELGSLEPTAQATVLHYRATPTTPP
jgi:alpha-galactosidase